MSSRQVKKLLKQQAAEDDSDDAEELARQADELAREEAKPKATGFAAMMMGAASSDEDEDEEETKEPVAQKPSQPTESDQPAKKKKKKNKKRKKKTTGADQVIETEEKKGGEVDEDMAFLDEVVKKNQEEQKKMAKMVGSSGIGNQNSILQMQRNYFSYKRELKALFSKAMGGGKEMDEGREKEGGQNAGDVRRQIRNMDMYTKKQRRMLLLQEKVANRSQKKVIANSKRQVLCVPEQNWPRIDPKMLTMKQVAIDKETGDKIFSFVKSGEYHSLQREFHAVQQTMDIQALAQFSQRNFYHHESLIYIADYLRLQGKFSEAATLLERCLFAFESAFCYEFQFVPPVDSTSNRQTLAEQFTPHTRLDFYSKNQEPLNRVLAECLLKYIDILGRKGCNRTAVEFCKLFLCLDPQKDPYGVLLRLDYYALRAKEPRFLLSFLERYPQEVFNRDMSLLVFPNLLLTAALAKKQIWEETHDSVGGNDSQAAAFEALMEMSSLNDLLAAPDAGESLIYAACLLYPDLVKQLVEKAAKQNLNSDLRKSYFSGYQGAKWCDMLEHELFTSLDDEPLAYPWLVTLDQDDDSRSDVDVRLKLYSIFMERSSILFNSDPTMLWFKETVGHLLNMIEAGSNSADMTDEFIAKVTSLVSNPFTLDRYMGLKNADFTDDVTTVNPEELLGNAAGGGGVGPAQVDEQAARQQQEQMVAEMMQRLNNPQPQQQQPGAQQVMREEFVDRDQLEMMEQNLIEQVEQMAGVDIEEIDDDEYERLQAVLLESMTAQQVAQIENEPATIEVVDDEDLPEGMAAQFVRPAAAQDGAQQVNLANQFADWANMRVAATEGEEQKGADAQDGEEEKK